MHLSRQRREKFRHFCKSGFDFFVYLAYLIRKFCNSNGDETGGGMREKWALVSGASSGIGQATAMLLARTGYNLYLLGRRHDRLEEFRDELAKEHGGEREFRVRTLDLRNRQEILSFVKGEPLESLEKIELLINNAGLAKGTEKIQDGITADWDDMIDTNVKGLLWLTREILPMLLRRKHGHIVNIGSAAGRWVYPGGGVYCATKFAVRAISEGLRMDLLGTNIRVTNVEPGMVNTEFSLVRLGDQKQADKVYDGMTPLTALDVAETVLWCIDRPRHVNIQEIVVFPTDQAAVGQVSRRS
jgi:NADP-dependent 3-hydroxy acid dehydrogenase YdfG